MQKIQLLNIAAMLGLSRVTAFFFFFLNLIDLDLKRLHQRTNNPQERHFRKHNFPLKNIICVLFFFMGKFNRLNFYFTINRHLLHKQHCVKISPNRQSRRVNPQLYSDYCLCRALCEVTSLTSACESVRLCASVRGREIRDSSIRTCCSIFVLLSVTSTCPSFAPLTHKPQ